MQDQITNRDVGWQGKENYPAVLWGWWLTSIEQVGGAWPADVLSSGWSGFCFALLTLSIHSSLRKKKKVPNFITLTESNFLPVSFVHTFVRKQLFQRTLKDGSHGGKDKDPVHHHRPLNRLLLLLLPLLLLQLLLWTMSAQVIDSRRGLLRFTRGPWGTNQDWHGKRYGLSSCSPAYKCKWENTANQRRSSKLLYRLLMVGPWRVHSSSSQFSHVSGWSQGRWEHEMLWTYSHLYFIFRLRGRWLLHNFLRLSLWVEFQMKSIQFDE